jgi:endonuclease/exonuclease/phosphatase family metal-dependent hydrolase
LAEVRLMTYNVLGGRGRTALAKVIASVDTDVLLANECPKTPLLWRWRCERLCADWGLRYVAGGRPAGSNLLAASARVRTLRTCAQRIAQPLFKPRRGIVAAQLTAGTATFGFVGAHLSLLPDSRREEVELVIGAAATLAGPVVVAGDLNEEPHGRSWRRLRRAGFVDTGRADELTFPANAPQRRIDALLVRGAVDVRGHEVPPVDHELLAAASDHCPVTAVLVL